MLVYPVEANDLKKIYDTVVTYRKENGPNTTVLQCDGERYLEVLLEDNNIHLPLQIVITDTKSVTTSVGICFSTVDTFVHDYHAINWLMLADYNIPTNMF